MNNFEATASFILPHDPVSRKRNLAKRPQAEISAANLGLKAGIGETGVALRFHTTDEYKSLTADQRKELRTHRDKLEEDGKGRNLSKNRKGNGKRNGENSNKNGPSDKKMKRMISEAVAKKQKELEDDAVDDVKMRSYILSVVNGAKAGTTMVPPPPAATIASTNTQPNTTPSATNNAPASRLATATIQRILKSANKQS